MTQAEIPVAHAIPLPEQNPVIYSGNMVTQPYIETGFAGTEEMGLAWRLGKTVRFFALVDVLFSLLIFVQYPPLLAISVLPILGYYGAKQYRLWKIYCYAVFVLVNLGLRVYAYTQSETVGGLLLTILGIVVQFWIFRIIYRFINSIRRLPSDQLAIIKNPQWEPIQTHIVW
jgi:hypothetical protein